MLLFLDMLHSTKSANFRKNICFIIDKVASLAGWNCFAGQIGPADRSLETLCKKWNHGRRQKYITKAYWKCLPRITISKYVFSGDIESKGRSGISGTEFKSFCLPWWLHYRVTFGFNPCDSFLVKLSCCYVICDSSVYSAKCFSLLAA